MGELCRLTYELLTDSDSTPSFALMDVQGPVIVTYVYQLVDGEVSRIVLTRPLTGRSRSTKSSTGSRTGRRVSSRATGSDSL